MPRTGKKRLTDAFVRTALPAGKYHDEHGLILRVMPSGSKQWVQRLVIHGRRRDIGLGGYPLVTLAEARDKAFANRKLARAGADPMAVQRRPDVPTFEEAATKVIEIHRPNWRNAKHVAQWTATLRAYAYPKIGNKRVDQVSTGGRDGRTAAHLE